MHALGRFSVCLAVCLPRSLRASFFPGVSSPPHSRFPAAPAHLSQAGDKSNPIHYGGSRDKESMVAFIRENATPAAAATAEL